MKDINVLKSLLLDNEDSIEVFSTTSGVKRTVFKGKNFSYAFLVSDVEITPYLKDNMKDVLAKPGMFVDFLQLYKMVELASELPYSIGKVSFQYKDGNLVLAIKTKAGKDSVFILGGSPVEGLVNLKNEIILQAKLLKILLRSFAGSSSVKVALCHIS